MLATERMKIVRNGVEFRVRLGPLPRDLVEETLAARLRELIERDELTTGDMLPETQAVAEYLGVGQDPVRRVLHTLEAEGKLQGREDWGWFVA